MDLPRFALERRAVVTTAALLLVFAGITAFLATPKREDPRIVIRTALVTVRWPGAPTRRVEQLVTDPLEKKIGELAEVERITSQSRVGFALLFVELRETLRPARVDQLWDEVRGKVARVALPEGCSPAVVDSGFGDVYDICLALYQAPPPGGWTPETAPHRYSPRRLERLAERVEDELKLIDPVARVDFWGVAEERIWVEIDTAEWARIDMTSGELAALLDARNIVAPGGTVEERDARFSVRPTGEFESVEEIGRVLAGRIDGHVPVLLEEMPFSVRRGYAEPLDGMAWFSRPGLPRSRCLVLGVSMKDGASVLQLGEDVEAAVARLKAAALPADVELVRINDLPRQVGTKVSDFVVNLLQAVGIVMLTAFFALGLRPGLVLATSVPLSMIAALAVVPMLGVEIEQFSIASLIIALGMVVDNATVVTENTMRLMEEGVPRRRAAIRGARSLSVPLLAATATTVAAFLPMLTIRGNMGEYVRSLPIVVACTLAASYLVAMLVAPLLCFLVLDPDRLKRARDRRPARKPGGSRLERVVGWAIAHRGRVLLSAAGAFAGSMLLVGVIGNQFFPEGERDQFFIEVRLPEGAPLGATDRVVREVERLVHGSSATEVDGETVERLASVTSFVGQGGPRLILTQSPEQDYPYFAYLVVNTTDARLTEGWVRELDRATRAIPGARIDVVRFSFGPPTDNPVGFRIRGPDDTVLRSVAEQALAIMRDTPGARSPRSDWGGSSYQLVVDIDADAANLSGVTNADVARTMNALLSGAPLTTFREGEHEIPVLFRTRRTGGDRLAEVDDIFVSGNAGKVPIAAFADVRPSWQPAVIARRGNVRTVTVGCRVAPGALSNEVASRMQPRLQALVDSLPPGYALEPAGEQEKTAESQGKIGAAMAIALALIVLVLVTQYDSLLKPLVILCTVPLALVGVVLGLWITGWPLGFMAMLGVLSLGGIVINNAIVLIDFLEELVRERGMPLREAAVTASRVRLKPILLTTATTVGGLLPLSLFGGALWQPMSNGMIAGLLFSTLLTLVFVPTLYVLFAERLGMRVVRRPAEE